MNVRHSTFSDAAKIYKLYRKVASVPGGLARLQHEITLDYIGTYLKLSLERGISLIAEVDGLIVGEIHAYKPEPSCFSHVLSNLTIAVDSDAQGTGIGRSLFEAFMLQVDADVAILRVELIARESNQKAIQFYQSLGFVIEGRFESRIKNHLNEYEADIPMAWKKWIKNR